MPANKRIGRALGLSGKIENHDRLRGFVFCARHGLVARSRQITNLRVCNHDLRGQTMRPNQTLCLGKSTAGVVTFVGFNQCDSAVTTVSRRRGHQFEQVTVRSCTCSAFIPIVELAIAESPRSAAIRQPSLLNATKNRVELGVTDVKGIMATFLKDEELLLNSKVSVSLTRTGAKCSDRPSKLRPKIRAKNRTAGRLAWAGTMVWFRGHCHIGQE